MIMRLRFLTASDVVVRIVLNEKNTASGLCILAQSVDEGCMLMILSAFV